MRLRLVLDAILLLGAILSPCLSGAAPFVNVARTTSETATLDAHDLAVMAAVVLAEANLTAKWKSLAAVPVECTPGEVKPGGYLPNILRDTSITSEVAVSLRQRNLKAFRVDQRTSCGLVQVIGSREYNRIVGSTTVSDRAFPSPALVYFMWLPGYDRQRREALVYYFTDGWGGLARLKREGRAWRVMHRQVCWRE